MNNSAAKSTSILDKNLLDKNKLKQDVSDIVGEVYKLSFKVVPEKFINIILAENNNPLAEVKTGEIIDKIIQCAENHGIKDSVIEHLQFERSIVIKLILGATESSQDLVKNEKMEQPTLNENKSLSDAKNDNLEDENKLGDTTESKQSKFRRIAVARTNKTIKAIYQIGNLSNKAAYEYQNEQIELIITSLKDAIAHVEGEFYNENKPKIPVIEL